MSCRDLTSVKMTRGNDGPILATSARAAFRGSSPCARRRRRQQGPTPLSLSVTPNHFH